MAYYNYHAMAKRLILTHNLIAASVFKEYHHIRPALVLYFKNHKPIPVRDYMWEDYLPLLREEKVEIQNPDGVDLSQFSRLD